MFIYGLIDPRENILRYIGKSFDPNKRFSQHVNHSYNPHMRRWIDKLDILGLVPRLVLLEFANDKNWQVRERYWINKIRRMYGKKVINIGDGGAGFQKGYRPSESIKQKMSKNHWLRKGKNKPANYLTDKQLLDRIRDKYVELGKVPDTTDLGSKAIAIFRRFGTWKNAIKLAGLSRKDDILRDLQYHQQILGKTPTFAYYRKHGKYSTDRVLNLFGCWNNAIKMAGLVPNEQVANPEGGANPFTGGRHV